MGKQVQVKVGYISVWFPSLNNYYSQGDTITFTDAEYAALAPALTQSITLLGSVSDPVRYSAIQYQPTINVLDYGALGDGTNDDYTAIQAALNAAPAGSIVQLPAGNFRIGTALVIPPFVHLRGTYGERDQLTSSFSRLKPKSSISGAAIKLLDKEQGGYSTDNMGIVISDLSLDGSALGGTVASAISATGYVHGVRIDNVGIYSFTKNGIDTASYTRLDASTPRPYSWNLTNVQCQQITLNSFDFANCTDTTMIGCRSINAGQHGYSISGGANSNYTNCRAEWSGQNGFYVTGSFGTTTGSGGATFTGCSTDRNGRNGFLVDSTGNSPLQFNGLMLRRDGRNGGSGGGSYAGFQATSATSPILINGISVYPGVDDDTTGTNSPQYGVRFTGNTYVDVEGAGIIQGASTGWSDGGSNTVLRRGANITERTGATNAPTAIVYPATGVFPGALPTGGNYIFAFSPDATTTSTRANNTMSLAPFYVGGPTTITRIGAEVTTVGEAGSKVRLGIYAADGANGDPGTLLVDAGQIAGDSATAQEITLGSSLPLAPGWYWAASTVQSAPTTQPTLRCGTRMNPYVYIAAGTGIPAAGTTILGRAQTNVSGALPNPAVLTGTAGAVPRIFFKLS